MSEPHALSGAVSGNGGASQVDILASLVGLTITETQRPGVVRFMSLAQAMAALVHAVPLPDDVLDLAPVFRPGLPGDRGE